MCVRVRVYVRVVVCVWLCARARVCVKLQSGCVNRAAERKRRVCESQGEGRNGRVIETEGRERREMDEGVINDLNNNAAVCIRCHTPASTMPTRIASVCT